MSVRSRYRGLTPYERLCKRVIKTASGCLEIDGSYVGQGYGAFYLAGKQMRAHRAAWIISRGPIPAGKQILHNCDNRRCVNINHLWLGTNAENNADMMQKGRYVKGALGKTWKWKSCEGHASRQA